MFRLRTPEDAQLRTHLERLTRAELTYPDAGATRDVALPTGYVHDRYRADLGNGSFDRAVTGLRTWQSHLGAGVCVYPRTAPLQAGTDVIVAARAGPLHALAPCRIVYVIDEPNRFGFAYGTLPGHPECGEEAFIVERDETGDASFSIIAFSRPAGILTRLGQPIARKIQRNTTHAYLAALQRYVR